MSKKLVFVILLFVNKLILAQSVTFSDSIFWQSNKIYQYNGNTIVNILSIKNGDTRNFDFLPVYFDKMKVNNGVVITDVSLTDVKYEVIDKETLNDVKYLEGIKEEPEINVMTTVARLQNLIELEMVPLRKNPRTGNIERITYFVCKVNYVNKAILKNTRAYATNSKLSNGRWHKIKVKKSGMYKLTYSQLAGMGFTNFNNIGIFGYGGMLNKVVTNNYIDDLEERPVYRVDANSNSVFDEGDYLLFFADGPNEISFAGNGNSTHTIHNYSEYSYYFVSDQGTLKQANNENSLSSAAITLSTCDEYDFLEKDTTHILKSGRRLFWSVFDNRLTHSFSMNLNNISTQDNMKVKVGVAVKSPKQTSFTTNINGTRQPEKNVIPTPYSVYAFATNLEYELRPSSANFNISLTFNRETSVDIAWLDYISVGYRKNLSLRNGWTQIRDVATSISGDNVKFVVSDATSNTVVWDITDRFNVLRIIGNLDGSKYDFTIKPDVDVLREFVAFNPFANIQSPIISGSSDVGKIANQNLHKSDDNVDLIIISHPSFYAQAQGIKALHEQHDGMKVLLATPDIVYNEFSSGCPDIAAIRNFVKMFYDRAIANSSKLPSNLLLVGDGSYDNLSTDASVSNFIFTFQSAESLNSSSSFVSDDFFVLMDLGENPDSYSDNIDLGVGRIPVKTVAEADAYLNKLRAYYGQSSYNSWKNNILLISDDAELNETHFQALTLNIMEGLNKDYPRFNVDALFLDDYEQVSTVLGHRYPDVNKTIDDAIANGVFLVNWIGHGNEKGLAHEQILTLEMIRSWKNTNKYPIFVTATCSFAPFDDHSIVSAGEEVLLNPNGGGIALFTTTRLVSAISFSKLFVDQIFALDGYSEINTLGISFKNAKEKTFSSNKRDFTLLGDPAIRPAIPKMKVQTTKINEISINEYNDTVKAKSLVKFEGIIENQNGQIAENFNGIIYPEVYDKFISYRTRSNDGADPLDYKAQKNILFKGQAEVVNGRFSFDFIVPMDISYYSEFGKDFGKVSYYATNSSNMEAGGYYNEFIIGGTDENAIVDNDGPEIMLYMNNEQFVAGGITNENPILLAKIKDESGVNTVGNGIGHDITLIVDDNVKDITVLNKFYKSAVNDFRSGDINYQMSNLSIGNHSLKVKVWDVFNNSNESATDFIVANSLELAIDFIFNYPNPFSTNTDFYFGHNQPNAKLDVLIQIFTISGKHVKTIKTNEFSTGFQSQPIHWNGLDEYGDKIAKGVYVYKIEVKSPTGNKVEKFEKLVILN
jgi:hypothetical protein